MLPFKLKHNMALHLVKDPPLVRGYTLAPGKPSRCHQNSLFVQLRVMRVSARPLKELGVGGGDKPRYALSDWLGASC